ncbi:MAG: sodium-dependent transporter, partial [Planctomycetota bacterium]|nr:sodium-dependent transporter [Planctomycetota bacterium]
MAIREQFSSRWGLILAALGMAIGTGNIWRFPREAAKHGGGAFLIAWIVALFVWSIPLLMVEFAIGKSTRRGTIGAFAKFLGPGHAWMGAFIGFCTLAILFYYSVVTGWCLKYFVATVIEPSTLQADPETYWKSFTNSSWSVFWSEERSLQPIIYHGLAILAGAAIVAAGVVKGIQRANRIFIPALFILLIIAAIRACTLDGASRGIEYLFHIDIAHLKNYETWLAAFSQSAWSTGAGWGLILTYAVYTREKEDVALNSFLTGLGNNSASLIAALAVIPVVFALLPQEEALAVMKQGNEGMTFTWLPQLFLGGQMPGGRFFLP